MSKPCSHNCAGALELVALMLLGSVPAGALADAFSVGVAMGDLGVVRAAFVALVVAVAPKPKSL